MGARKKKPGWYEWLTDGDSQGYDTFFESVVIEPDPLVFPPFTRINTGYAPADPLFPQQWHLFDAEGVDMDINVTLAWLDYSGSGVRVGVYDDAVQYTHPDLNDNYDASLHFTYAGSVADPTPTGILNHGTLVAGIIAAEQNNAGGVGVAFNASITAVPIYGELTDPYPFVGYRAAAMRYQDHFDVVNHSWGPNQPFLGIPHSESYMASRLGIAHAAEAGRGGLGTVMVSAAGNLRHAYTDGDGVLHRESDSNAAAPHTNDRHVVTVAAAGADGYAAYKSNPGANLLVTAPSNADRDGLPGITTTDRTGHPGASTTDYWDQFGGTSAAAPIVSGVVALMLEANPDLGWRDVREILAYSAKHLGSEIGSDPHPLHEEDSWQINHATDWNGGGLHFSRDYGFGLIDALAAVRLAETWTEQKTSVNEQHAADAFAYKAPMTIPDANDAGIIYGLEITENIRIESITLTLDFTHDFADNLTIEVTSPAGTVSKLLWRSGGDRDISDGWNFTSNKFWGESSLGTWTVKIADRAAGHVGSIQGGTLDVYGAAASANDTYVYTNEFGVLIGVGDDRARATLSDRDGGIDAINTSAVSGDSFIDLSAAMASSIAGRALSIAGTLENVYAGDGNDTLIGNASGNALRGMRGNDTIYGRDGNDTIEGGAGNDWMYGEAGNDTFVIVAGGTDMIVGGANTDALSFASFTSGISLDLSARSTSFGALGSITFSEVEDVVGTGHADTLTGDAAANRLDGGAGTDSLLGGLGNDVLIGGLGADMLNGGLGLDVFLFDAALNARTNVDAIKGFNVADDLIQLENAIFTRLPGIGTLEAEAFHVGFAAHDASDRIIYNSATGALFYDADGNGFGAAVQFASLSAALGLTHADFVIV